MYNPKFENKKDLEYHFIGNFIPIPGDEVLIPCLQFIHRYCNEKWDLLLEYMEENWNSIEKDYSFDQYIEMTLQDSKDKFSDCIYIRGKKIIKKYRSIREKYN